MPRAILSTSSDWLIFQSCAISLNFFIPVEVIARLRGFLRSPYSECLAFGIFFVSIRILIFEILYPSTF